MVKCFYEYEYTHTEFYVWLANDTGDDWSDRMCGPVHNQDHWNIAAMRCTQCIEFVVFTGRCEACVSRRLSVNLPCDAFWISFDRLYSHFLSNPQMEWLFSHRPYIVQSLRCFFHCWKRRLILSHFDHIQTKRFGRLSVFVWGHSPQYLSLIKCIACSYAASLFFSSVFLADWICMRFDWFLEADSASYPFYHFQAQQILVFIIFFFILFSSVRSTLSKRAIWNWYTIK